MLRFVVPGTSPVTHKSELCSNHQHSFIIIALGFIKDTPPSVNQDLEFCASQSDIRRVDSIRAILQNLTSVTKRSDIDASSVQGVGRRSCSADNVEGSCEHKLGREERECSRELEARWLHRCSSQKTMQKCDMEQKDEGEKEREREKGEKG